MCNCRLLGSAWTAGLVSMEIAPRDKINLVSMSYDIQNRKRAESRVLGESYFLSLLSTNIAE